MFRILLTNLLLISLIRLLEALAVLRFSLGKRLIECCGIWNRL